MLWTLVAVGALYWPPSPVSATSEQGSMTISGATRSGERFAATFSAIITDRPIRNSEHGYSPVARTADGQPIPARYYTPLTLTWDFGDGTSATIKDETTASHTYADDGEYTVTAVARDQSGEFARASHTVTIVNTDPASARIAATLIDPENLIVELSGWAEDVPGDPLHFRWDFGDGEGVEGPVDSMWRVTHRYPSPGRYEVTLTVTDDDYPSTSGSAARNDGKTEKRRTITVGHVDSGPERAPIDTDAAPVALTNRVTGSSAGVVSARFDAEIHPFAGLYLAPVSSGACRFMLSFRDDAQLIHGSVLVDMFGLPPEGGRYRVGKPNVSVHFKHTAESYRADLRSIGGPFGAGGVGDLVQKTLDGAGVLDGETRDAITRTLRDIAGIGAQAQSGRGQTPIPARSPLVDESIAFTTDAGTFEFEFVPGERAVGNFDVTMTPKYGRYKGQPVKVRAELALDMGAAASDGMVRAANCGPPPFELEAGWPKNGDRHIRFDRPSMWVNFSDPVAPDTLDSRTVQLVYTDTSGAQVPVPTRLLRDHDRVYVVPESDLLSGVYYDIRLLTGDEGVRSRKGSLLASEDGGDWVTATRFSTRVDIHPLTDGSRLLSCRLYQPARDVPLIAGKPAMARVGAHWQRQPGVHPDHQVREFNGTVELYGPDNRIVGQTPYRFVRPDLWESRGISRARAEQHAQVAFTPRDDMKGAAMPYGIKVAHSSIVDPLVLYRGRCPLTMWDRKPTLSIDFIALTIDEWRNDPSILQGLMPTLQRLADASVDYAWEQFPVLDIDAGPVRVLSLAERVPPLQPPHTQPPFACRAGCIMDGYGDELHAFLRQRGEPGFHGIGAWLHTQSSADVIVAFGPHLRLEGGIASATLRDGRGLVLVPGGGDAELFPRYVNAIVHELGHVLGLDHLPYVQDAAERARVVPLRDGSTPFRYEGIDAMRIRRDGLTAWNKSSRDGNEQGGRLFPLMFPGTIPTDDAFIANHHYRQIQRLLEELDR